jgi:predicted DNA-binding transcriptional regulator YafY
MNKTDRMLAIVLELQARGRRRAEDLARTFETSKRTIYRDIQALCEAGVPITATPGQGYGLMQGYFLPPLSFTTEEATMLLLGSDYMTQNFDAQYREAAQSASRKIAGVLPEQLRDDVRYLQQNIRLVAPAHPDEHDTLQKLRRAILDRTRVRFSYHAHYRRNQESAPTLRDADPYALLYLHTSWHLVAFCHLRQDQRVFKLERMEGLELLTTTFQRPKDHTPRQRQERDISRNLTVQALFPLRLARWVRESLPYYTTASEETETGLQVTLRVRQIDDVLPWLLSWGGQVQILEPAELRERLCREAEAMLRMYEMTTSLLT